MNCRTLEQCLDACLEGKLTDEERGSLDRHLESCGACRHLLSIARGEVNPAAGIPEGFTESVLERTGGSPCVRARQLLCEYVDGHLSPPDFELVCAHLDNCQRCVALAAGLSELQNHLPGMAEIEPDPVFTAAVLRRFSALADHRADPWTRVHQWWLNLVRRPRFSWEAAYVGTLLLVLAFGNPLSPSYGSLRNLASPQSAPRVALQRVSRQVPQLWDVYAGKSAQAATDAALRISSAFSAAERLAAKLPQEIALLSAFSNRILEKAHQLWDDTLSGKEQKSQQARPLIFGSRVPLWVAIAP